MSELVVVNGNPRIGSRTGAVAAALADVVAPRSTRVIELASAVAVNLGRDPVAPTHPQPDAVAAVTAARVLIVATPSYKGTYTGLLKVFLDQFAHGSLDGVIAVPVVVAGSPAHAEATAADLARLLEELGASVVTTLTVLESQLDDIEARVAPQARELIDRLAHA